MHEMSIAESILGIIEDNALSQGFEKVRRVRLEIGRFAGVEIPALRFGFDVVTRGSRAEGAALDIDEVPGLGLCFGCGEEVEIAHRLDPCPRCGSGQVTPVGGDEMKIKDLEVI
ncbi:MAG: hydrogenase maturation nickel metallochaperone HypA [Rubricella sp.]